MTESKPSQEKSHTDVTEDERWTQLSHGEKVEHIEAELQSLLNFCVAKGLSNKEIASCIKSFTGEDSYSVKKTKNRKWFLFGVAVFVAACAALIHWNPAYHRLDVYSRLAFIQILPYWDWTKLYDRECLIDNPYLKGREYNEDSCSVCKDLLTEGIDRLKNISSTRLTEEFLQPGRALIISDGLKGWENIEHFKLPNLVKLYKESQELQNLENCSFYSTILKERSVYDFMRDAEAKELANEFHVFWENCKDKATKFLRRIHKRPHFLPQSTELGPYSHIDIGKGKWDFNETKGSVNEFDAQGTLTTVIFGRVQVKLFPVQSCEEFGCKNATVEVNAGETILIPAMMYGHDCVPYSEELTVAISSSLFWFE